MSALPFLATRNQAIAVPPILHDSRYESDSEYSLKLLAATCWEQEGRLHTLNLLSDYLASSAGGRKRQLLAKELQALRDLYEAVWCEPGCAFGDLVICSAREAVEHEALCRQTPATEERESHGEQQTFF